MSLRNLIAVLLEGIFFHPASQTLKPLPTAEDVRQKIESKSADRKAALIKDIDRKIHAMAQWGLTQSFMGLSPKIDAETFEYLNDKYNPLGFYLSEDFDCIKVSIEPPTRRRSIAVLNQGKA